MSPYVLTFAFKNLVMRKSIDLTKDRPALFGAMNFYNVKSNRPGANNPKSIIAMHVFPDRIEITLQSTKRLNPLRVGNSLNLFSKILVNHYNFAAYLTPANPGKLFVSI